MKTKSLALFFLALSFIVKAQNPRQQQEYNLQALIASISARLSSVPCEGNNSGTDSSNFDELFKQVFSTVVLGKGDVILNGSAFSYTQDKNAKTFSLNGVVLANNRILVDLGASIKSKDGNFTYYKSNAWESDITLKAGLSVQFFKGSMFYTPSNCEKALKKEAEFFQKKIDSIDQQIKKKFSPAELSNKIEIVEPPENITIESVTPEKLASWKREFDVSEENVSKYHGYQIAWANLTGTYTNSSFNIANDSIINEKYQEKYNTISKFTIDGNLNFHRKGQYNFFIVQGYYKVNRMSILDNPAYAGKTIKLSNSVQGQYNLYYYDSKAQATKQIGEYEDIKLPIITNDLGFNFAYLRGLKQRFGANLKLNFNMPADGNRYKFQDNYTLLFGPIIRLAKDPTFSTATITVHGGVENQLYKENGWDSFLVKISAAIPFNVFSKNKSS